MMSASEANGNLPPVPVGPLSGVTVIDLTRVLAGPFCTIVLADLGARVIKVEQPGTGNDSRAHGPFLKGSSAYFGSLNRGKDSIAFNLKDKADRAVFEKLITRADVLVENYRPGTMEKLGLGWHDMRRRLAFDRRCLAFFHPALADEPLIFVEVALLGNMAGKIEPIIRAPLPKAEDIEADG
jgi:hypothetical protein